MGRISKWGVVATMAAILAIGTVAPALAGSGVSTTRPFSDGNWAPPTHQGVSTMRPFSDGTWSPGTAGVISMRPFSDGSWTPGTTGVLTMRPFSDPNAIGHVRTVTATASHPAGDSAGSRLGITLGLIAGLLLLVAAAGYASRQRRARPA